MDYLRSAYSTSIHQFIEATGQHVTIPIVWYKANEYANPIGIRHQYASANWTRGVAYQEQVGEILADPRPWRNGAKLPTLYGTSHCGDDALWTGTLYQPATPIALGPQGYPVCCDQLDTSPCAYCPGGLGHKIYVLVMRGGTGDYATFNGNWRLPNVFPCAWQLFEPGVRGFTLDQHPTYVNLFCETGAGIPDRTWQAPGWDCDSGTAVWTDMGGLGVGTPPTVQVY